MEFRHHPKIIKRLSWKRGSFMSGSENANQTNKQTNTPMKELICITQTYWELEMWICSTQTTRGSDCVGQGLKLMPFWLWNRQAKKKRRQLPENMLISASESTPHDTHKTSLSRFLHYHPDTKPLYTHLLDFIKPNRSMNTHTHTLTPSPIRNPLTMNPVWFSLTSVLQRGADNPWLWDIIRISSI